MFIEIVRFGENKLSSTLFRFWVCSEYRQTLQIILDIYAERTRRTKRCKWVNERMYARLDSRHSDMLAQEVKIPISIEEELKQKIKDMVDESTIKMQIT